MGRQTLAIKNISGRVNRQIPYCETKWQDALFLEFSHFWGGPLFVLRCFVDEGKHPLPVLGKFRVEKLAGTPEINPRMIG